MREEFLSAPPRGRGVGSRNERQGSAEQTRLGRADEVATFKARLAILRGRVQAGFSGVGLEMAIDAFADQYDAFVEGVLPPR